MNKLFLTSILMLFFNITFLSQPDQNKQTASETFWVNGNCEMCQARIQKAALSVKGVKMATWNIETKMLSIIYNAKKCNIDDVKKTVASVGHDNDLYKAPDEVYNNLHSCCKYERK